MGYASAVSMKLPPWPAAELSQAAQHQQSEAERYRTSGTIWRLAKSDYVDDDTKLKTEGASVSTLLSIAGAFGLPMGTCPCLDKHMLNMYLGLVEGEIQYLNHVYRELNNGNGTYASGGRVLLK